MKEHYRDDEGGAFSYDKTASATERPHFDRAEVKRLRRKVDLRLLPALGMLYSIALIDRINISAARISGMGDDLGLEIGSRYTIALVVFFIPYIIFELPSNLLLRRVGSANWLSGIAFSWGVVMIGQGFVTNYRALAGCRFLLGFFEAGFFPGCAYLITCWYVRYETQQRLAWFYLTSALIGGFSSLLAAGLITMEGLGGLRGWQWIFVIEGLMTVTAAVIAWFVIVDFPDKAVATGFLTPDEAELVKQRLDDDRGDATPDSLTWGKLAMHLGDFKLWAFALMFMSSTMPAYALAYFAPVIVAGMGYTAVQANALSTPPVVFAVIIALFVSFLSDKFRRRWPALVFNSLIAIAGLLMTAYHKNDVVRYIGLFLGQAGAQSNIPTVLAYQSNNIRTQSKRSVGAAVQIGFGAIGGIIGSTVFFESETPNYPTGLWVTTGLQLLILTLTGLLSVYFIMMNRKVSRGTLRAPLEGQPGFKFTL